MPMQKFEHKFLVFLNIHYLLDFQNPNINSITLPFKLKNSSPTLNSPNAYFNSPLDY